MDLLNHYSNRADIAVDLRKYIDQLSQASGDAHPNERQSVRSIGGKRRSDLLATRLTDNDIRQLVTAFKDGTPKWRLAERYGISLSSVKRLLRRYHTA